MKGRPKLWATQSGHHSESGLGLPLEVLVVVVLVVVEALLLVVHIRPAESSNIPDLSAVEVTHVPQSVCAKDDAP